MGCGSSKDAKQGGDNAAAKGGSKKQAAPTPRYPLLDTPEEQSKRFLELCDPQQLHLQAHKGRHHKSKNGVPPVSPFPNPLAVELQRVYTETRQRVFEQQKGDEAALAAKAERERAEKLRRVHGRTLNQNAAGGPGGSAATTSTTPPPPPPQPAQEAATGESDKPIVTTNVGEVPGAAPASGAAATADADPVAKDTTSSTPQDHSPVLPPVLQNPAQDDFTLYINDSIAQARRRHFTAYDVVEAVELFVGFVKHDLHEQQAHAQQENAAGDEKTAPSVPWTCRMQCTLTGDSEVAEHLLEEARHRWKMEREASHLKHQVPTADQRRKAQIEAARRSAERSNAINGGGEGGAVTYATEPLEEEENGAEGEKLDGGRGMLFIDAVFESAVPGSFDRRTPWQLEVVLYFTE